MEIYILLLIVIPFLYINYSIVKNDFIYKKIPNKLLLYLILLIPIWYIFLLYTGFLEGFNFFKHLIQIFLSLSISFFLYSFGVWSAGDAKYLLVLSLFIPTVSIIFFIGNIALITLAYLIIYFIYFYFIKVIFNKTYGKSLFGDIYKDLSHKLKIFLKSSNGNYNLPIILKKIFSWLVIFLVIFVSIRLARFYFIDNYIISENSGNLIFQLIEISNGNTFWLLLSFLGLLIGLIYSIKYLTHKFKKFIISRFPEKSAKYIEISKYIFMFIITSLLLTYLNLEYVNNPVEIKRHLYLIFTFYIFLYLIFLILRYSFKITFVTAEQNFIDIKNLSSGTIVDKEYLIKLFGNQECLEKYFNTATPTKYLQKIQNPIDNETKNKLVKIFKKVNTYHSNNKTPNFKSLSDIKILNTFSFGIYIFVGFIITYVYGSEIINYMINFVYYLLYESLK